MWVSILLGVGIGFIVYVGVILILALIRKLKEKKKVNKDIEE